MEIKARTTKDKLYDNRIPILIGVIVTMLVSITSINQIEKHTNKELEAAKLVKQSALKIETISKNKPTLVCNNSKLLSPSEYDLITINNIAYIVTEATSSNPSDSPTSQQCEIYTNVTKSLVVVPKPPIEIQHALEIDGYKSSLVNSNTKLNDISKENTKYEKALKIANTDNKSLKSFIKVQDAEIDRLLLVEAKYNEIKGLLSIVLDKKELHLKDIMVKPIKPKVKKIEITKQIKEIKKVKIQKNVISKVDISGNAKRLQRMLYTIRYLTQTLKKNKDKLVLSPSNSDLDKFKISQTLITNYKSVSTQLLTVIDRLSITQSKILKLDSFALRNSIKSNVGI